MLLMWPTQFPCHYACPTCSVPARLWRRWMPQVRRRLLVRRRRSKCNDLDRACPGVQALPDRWVAAQRVCRALIPNPDCVCRTCTGVSQHARARCLKPPKHLQYPSALPARTGKPPTHVAPRALKCSTPSNAQRHPPIRPILRHTQPPLHRALRPDHACRRSHQRECMCVFRCR